MPVVADRPVLIPVGMVRVAPAVAETAAVATAAAATAERIFVIFIRMILLIKNFTCRSITRRENRSRHTLCIGTQISL